MKIENTTPPNFEEIVKAFPVSKKTVYTYGETIYAPFVVGGISKDLVEHERVHSVQQGNDPAGWWRKYIADPEFRLEQEVSAYRVQYKFLCSSNRRFNGFKALKYLAGELSSSQYQLHIGIFDAIKLIGG